MALLLAHVLTGLLLSALSAVVASCYGLLVVLVAMPCGAAVGNVVWCVHGGVAGSLEWRDRKSVV